MSWKCACAYFINSSKSPSGRDALIQFHKQWYGDDKLTRTVANGL